MDKFLNYISSLDPDFLKTIHSASDKEIETFERLVGSKFPLIYRDFLSRMGHGTGSLVMAWDCSFNIGDLIGVYEEEVISGKTEIPSGHILIGIGGVGVEHVYLKVDDYENLSVFYLVDDPPSLYAESFEKLLFRLVFVKYKPKVYKYITQLSSGTTEREFEKARGLATDLGFEEKRFSDSITYCGEKENTAIIINQYERDPLLIVTSSQRKADLHSINRVLKDNLDLD